MRNVVLILLKSTMFISFIVTVVSLLVTTYTTKTGAAWALFGGIALLTSLPVWVMAKILLSPHKESSSFLNLDK